MPHALADSQAALNALRGPVRLRTLTGLRWLAVGGQTLAIVIVHFGLGYPAPLGLCLGAIAASAWLNLFTMLRYSPQRFLSDREAAGYIAFDIVQLCALLFFTGGLQNPFSALIIAPVTIAASLLPLRHTVMIAALAIAGVSLLALYHMPMPWAPGETLELSPIYKAGVWTALSFTIAFFAAYAHRIAAESAQMRSALAATQLVLAREERLAALTGGPEASAAAQNAFKVFAQKQPLPDSALVYTIDHSRFYYIADREGQPRLAVVGGVSAQELAALLRRSIRNF